MAKSRLENEFFPIAKTGKFPQGDLTEKIFDQIVSNFNPTNYEPPVTLGHIRSETHGDKPAMGWISEVVRIGDTLFAKAKQVWDKFDSMVQEGRYKKRSIGIRANTDGTLYLHHLAFLGSVPPAVEGLPDIYKRKYAADNEESQKENYNFEENSNNPNPKKKGVKGMKEYTEAEIKEIQENAANKAKIDAEAAAKTDYEAKLETEKKAAADAAKAEAEKEFAKLGDAEKARIAHETVVDEYCNKGLKEGFINPAMIKAGLKNFLYSLVENTEMEFSQEDKDGKKTTVKSGSFDLLKNILTQYSAAPEGETGDPDGSKNENGDDYEQEKKKATEYAKENKVPYSEALKAVRDMARA